MQLIFMEAKSNTKASSMLTASMTKMVKKDKSPRSSFMSLYFISPPLFPVVFWDAGTLGPDVNRNEIELPEAAKVAAAGYRDIEGGTNLDFVRGTGGVYLISQVLYVVHLAGKEGEEGVRSAIDASGELYLFDELVGTVVQFLLYRYDMEDVDDKGYQDDRNQDEEEAADVGGFSSFWMQQSF